MFGSCAAGNDADRLVLVRVELGARRRVDLDHLVALERLGQLAQRRVDALEQLLGRRRRDGDRRLEAVAHRQQALGEALDRELARLADSSSARRRVFSASALARR